MVRGQRQRDGEKKTLHESPKIYSHCVSGKDVFLSKLLYIYLIRPLYIVENMVHLSSSDPYTTVFYVTNVYLDINLYYCVSVRTNFKMLV